MLKRKESILSPDNGYHLVLVTIEREQSNYLVTETSSRLVVHISLFNELGYILRILNVDFPIGSMIYLVITLLEKFQMATK